MESLKRYFSDIYFTLRVYRRGLKLRFQNYSFFKPRREIKRRTVIAMLDYRNQRIGLSDRLRGVIYTYNCVKEMRAEGVDVEFKIDFRVPFELSQYLVPASYDWQISSDDISYNPLQVEIVKFGTRGDNQRHREYLKRRIAESRHNQIHVYSIGSIAARGLSQPRSMSCLSPRRECNRYWILTFRLLVQRVNI